MEKRRAIISTIYVFAFALLWMNLAPKIFPQFFPQQPPAGQAQQPAGEDADELAADSIAEDHAQDAKQDAQNQHEGEAAADNPDDGGKEAEHPASLVEHPRRQIELGSLDPKSGYFMQVTLTTQGGAIQQVQLNDPRYTSIGDHAAPLKVVGDDPQTDDHTLQLSLAAIDRQLARFHTSLAEVDWKVTDAKPNEATFSYDAPDGSLRVVRHYHLNSGDVNNPDVSVAGYLLDVDLTIENLSDKPQSVQYTMLGPVGLPLEDRDNSRTFVEVKAGTLDDPADPADITNIAVTAAGLVKQTGKAQRLNDPSKLDIWRAPIKYIGADVQYFAALIFPKADQLKDDYFEQAQPVIVHEEGDKGQWSDVSVKLTSEEYRLKSQGKIEHQFQVFFGPKRSELIDDLGAGGVRALGWFGFVAQGMLSLLDFFHKGLMLPYGMAIVLLTVVVRACLFPISKKIAKNQQRMKELQPKMEALRTKYADNKEKQAEEYRKFMAEHGFNPLAGCLPMFLQLPIFIGLYRSLYVAVDLRNAKFLWIDNLAAPDQLFTLPFTVPFLGWTHLNALPLIAMGLFFVQQKLFMPPPTSDEQAMQFKMMNFFTLFIGVMFYRVPAGLCLYFITSSLWGICERKLLEKLGLTTTPPAVATASGELGSGGTRLVDDAPPKPPGFLARLRDAADEAHRQNQKRQETTNRAASSGSKKRGRKYKPGR